MRKPRRLTPEELAPYQWQMPRSAVRGQRTEVRREDHRDSGLTSDLRPLTSEQWADTSHSPELIDWAALFGNANPVEIEVGMGKGLFLLTSALARPDVNFFGIEIVRKYQLYATSRFALRHLSNVKTVCADARWVFRQFIRPASVAAVHVYFPDPWWKARHKKRRVFTPGFAADAARILRTGAQLLIATDVEEYFGVMVEIVQAMPAFREVHAEMSTASVEEAGFQTNFERKARQKGTPIWRAAFERTTGPITEAIDPIR